MSSVVYTVFQDTNAIEWSSSSVVFRCMLVSSDYTPDAAHDHPVDGPHANEVSGGGYERQTVTARATVDDDHTAANLSFKNVIGNVRYLVIYKVVNNDTGHILALCVDLGNHTLTGNDFQLRWDDGVVFETGEVWIVTRPRVIGLPVRVIPSVPLATVTARIASAEIS